jgi:hypothetical protein
MGCGKVPVCIDGMYPISVPKQPQINGGKRRKEHLNASYLHLKGNMGLPKQVIGQGAGMQRLRPVW